jgi:ATP-dependent metalloprotease
MFSKFKLLKQRWKEGIPLVQKWVPWNFSFNNEANKASGKTENNSNSNNTNTNSNNNKSFDSNSNFFKYTFMKKPLGEYEISTLEELEKQLSMEIEKGDYQAALSCFSKTSPQILKKLHVKEGEGGFLKKLKFWNFPKYEKDIPYIAKIKAHQKFLQNYFEAEFISNYNLPARTYIKFKEEDLRTRASFIVTLLFFGIVFGIYFGAGLYLYFLRDKSKENNEEKDPKEPVRINLKSYISNPYTGSSAGKGFKIAKNITDRLDQVKGIDEVRGEIEEIVKMLKNPAKYEQAGAKLIRGILLIGKPGTGKTLLARSLAGESGVNFIYVSASEFDKSMIGQGNKLLKELFEQARKNQPCIIFIDEIDTLLHASRRQGKFSTSYERSLINTFLSEMDGFKKNEHIFILAATNSEKDLDKAALRPGRFDKIIHVPLPDKKGRKELFELYLGRVKLPMLSDISTEVLSKMTPGFSGAEIENMINIAIISAVDSEKEQLSKSDFDDARDRVVLGIKKRLGRQNLRSLLQTAIHEAGHTLICFKDPICRNSIHKVTITKRGNTKGKTSTLADDIEGTRKEFLSMIDMSLAGLLAEELYFGEDKVSVGCGNDLPRATNIAKGMVKKYAMNKAFGYMVVEDEYQVSHRIAANTRNTMDLAVDNILKERTSRVKETLKLNSDSLKVLAQKLVEYEELNKEDIEKILSGKENEIQQAGFTREKIRDVKIEGIAL